MFSSVNKPSPVHYSHKHFSASPLASYHYTIRLQCALSPVTWSHTGCWRPTGWHCYSLIERVFDFLIETLMSRGTFPHCLLSVSVSHPPLHIIFQVGVRMGKVNFSLKAFSPTLTWDRCWLLRSMVLILLSNWNINSNVECVRMCSALKWENHFL